MTSQTNLFYPTQEESPLIDWARTDLHAVAARQILHYWVVKYHPTTTVQRCPTIAGALVDILVELQSGARVALCYVSAFEGRRLDADRWRRRHEELRRAGIADVWLFPPHRRHFVPVASDPASPANGLILDQPLFRAMRGAGAWPLILNVQREEVANLIVPHGQVALAHRLPVPPIAADVLHVRIARLQECRLCKDGIATRHVNAATLEAPRNRRGATDRRGDDDQLALAA